MRLAAKVDNNQAEIVRALRDIGCTVLSLAAIGHGIPDLLVARQGRMFLIECKSPGGKLEATQHIWRQTWAAPVYVVYGVPDALNVVLGGEN